MALAGPCPTARSPARIAHPELHRAAQRIGQQARSGLGAEHLDLDIQAICRLDVDGEGLAVEPGVNALHRPPVGAVKPYSDPQHTGQQPNLAPVGSAQGTEARMPPARGTLAVIPGHQGDQLQLAGRESGQAFAVTDQVVRMAVMGGVGHEAPDVVEQSRCLQQFAVARAQAVNMLGLVEQLEGQLRGVFDMDEILVITPGQGQDAAPPEVAEVMEPIA